MTTFMLGALALTSAVFAQEKIGLVDSEKVLEEFEDAKIARRTLDQAAYQWKRELDSLRNAYNTAEAEFKVQQPMLSEDALRARQQELTTMRQRYENFAQEIWGEGGKLEKKHGEVFAPVMDKINETIESLAQAEELSIVIDISSGSVLYADVGLDITADVIAELNREYATTTQLGFKKKAAVFGITALDQRSQSENLGGIIRSYVNSAVRSFEKELNYEMASDADINQTYQQYGRSFDQQVDATTAMNMGSAMNADFIYIGTVERQGGDIVVALKLLNPQTREELPEVTDRISEKDEPLLQQRVFELVKELQVHVWPESTEESGEESPEEPQEGEGENNGTGEGSR